MDRDSRPVRACRPPALPDHVDPRLDDRGGRDRPRLARGGGVAARPEPDLPEDDQDDHRPPALRHPGGRHRRPRRPEAGGEDGGEGPRLLRGRHHPGPLHRPPRHQPDPGRGGGGAAGRARPPGRPGAETDLRRGPAARLPRERGEVGGGGHVLQVVVFSVLFGISLARLGDDKRRPMLAFAQSLSETMFKFTNIVMYFAPVGVGAAIAYTVGHMGLGILANLFKLLATLYLALAAFLLLVLLPVAVLARVPRKRFLAAIAEPVSIAFATTSSEAALPLAMERMEELGVPRSTVAFVMPTGYSFNLDGSTLYLALASIFVAQAAGIHLSLGQQLLIVFTLMLTSKGVAGVPRATLVILLGTAASFGLPEWPILAILGIDELMDMARTSVNVMGNCLATVVVARWEGQLPAPTPSPSSTRGG